MKKLVKWSKYIALILVFSSCTVLAAPNNINAKKWMEQTFTSGTEIYDAYRTIMFDIEYIIDSGVDKWQHPEETLKLKGGDCEDAMLLFSSLISSDLKNVRIVWGYVWNLQGVKYKHVWANVISKTGAKHVLINVKSFGWNGLFSELYAQRVLLKREIILSITQKAFNDVIDYLKDVEDFNNDVYEEVIKLVPYSDTRSTDFYELYNIFEKLHGVFSTKIEKS